MIKKLLSNFIKLDDFKKVEHFFIIKNETTGLLHEDFQKIKLLEIEKESLTLYCKGNICRESHKLLVYIFNTKDRKSLKSLIKKKIFKNRLIEIFCKVEQIETLPDGQAIKLKLIEFEELKWKKLSSLYRQSQEKVSKLSGNLSEDLEVDFDNENEDVVC